MQRSQQVVLDGTSSKHYSAISSNSMILSLMDAAIQYIFGKKIVQLL